MSLKMQGIQVAPDHEFCFVKNKMMRKRKECATRKKHSETATKPKFDKKQFARHKYPNSNSNFIGNNRTVFQQIRNTVKK